MPICWYMSLYYKYRDYPVNFINNKYKRNQLKTVYNNIFAKLSLYFFIDLDSENNQIPQPPLNNLSSNKKSMRKLYANLNYSNFEKKFDSHTKISNKKLKSQELENQNQSNQQLSNKSFGSAQFDQNAKLNLNIIQLQKLSELLKIMVNTSKQQIYNVILKNKSGSSLDIANEDSSEEQSSMQKCEIQQGTTLFRQTREQIFIQTIPITNEQINYYFLEFCSRCDVKQEDFSTIHSQKLTHNKRQSYMSLKDVLPKKGINLTSESLDGMIMQILNRQLQSSNEYLSKFQAQPPATQKQLNQLRYNSQNIIIQTWLEILTLVQEQSTLYQIISELVHDGNNNYVHKINSYIYFITLANTKSILVRTISKFNFLSLIPQILDGNRLLTDLKLEKALNLIKIRDLLLDRPIYNSEAITNAIEKWKHIGRIVSQLLVHDDTIFWAKVFQDSCQLMDEYLDQKIQFSYSLIVLYEALSNKFASLISIPEWKKQYYKKAIKIILERQIGYNSGEIITTKAEIKSKISMGQNLKTIDGIDTLNLGDDNFIFYDQRTADNQSKIFQFRQWERVVLESIQRLKGYKKLLETGMTIFKGNPECVTIFFLQSYFNFKKIEVVCNINFSETIDKYCVNRINMSTLQGIKLDAHPLLQIKTKLIENDLHRQNHKYISKQIEAKFLSRQASAATTKHQLSNSNYQKVQQDNDRDQINYSYLQVNLQSQRKQGLPLLDHSIVKNTFGKLKQIQGKEEIEKYYEHMMLAQEINNYIKLINECNFICNTVQNTHILAGTEQISHQNDPSQPHLIILRSQELVSDLNALNVEEEQSKNSKKATINQSTRKTSANTALLRTSATNNNAKLLTKKDSDLLMQNNNQDVQMDFEKIISKVKFHIRCLQLIISIFYKSNQLQKLLSRNVESQQQHNENVDKTNTTLNRRILSKSDQSRVKKLTTTKIITFLKKYQSLHKNNDETIMLKFEKQLKEQIQLCELNNQILLIFIFLSSLQISYDSFLAIYKQDLISQQKISKIKVIGKPYFQNISALCKKHIKINNAPQYDEVQQQRKLYIVNLLVIIVSLIQQIYERNQEQSYLQPYNMLLINYFVSKTYNVNNLSKCKGNEDLLNLSKIMLQCFDWNQQDLSQVNLKQFMLKLLELRTFPQSSLVVPQLKKFIQKQFQILKNYNNLKQQAQYLQKKLLYLMLREIYFDSYYDIRVFQLKSLQARKNFEMYETQMLNFFEEIIKKDQQQFKQMKSEELKQRSSHLQGYLLDYLKQPDCAVQYKHCLIKTVCIFNKILNILSENKEFEMKKRGSNSITVFRKNKKKSEPIYMYYLSTQYITPKGQRVKVFENQSYYFYQAVQIYEDMLFKKVLEGERRYSIYKELGFNIPTSICISFDEQDFQLLRKSKQSLLALWINIEFKKLHQNKMQLSQQNFLSKIQKLYIDLDVRHKVFESFKQKILNYQMQKTKIYHQYMDYIRGLKLDVYSHVSGQDPFPYFKLVNAIKKYRLNIKRNELQEKVNEQFGKNLGKWNDGIQKDLSDYNQWVINQKKFWLNMNEGSNKNKKQLYQIYKIVSKQLKRQQNKTIQMALKVKQAGLNPNNKSSVSIRKVLYKQKSLIK